MSIFGYKPVTESTVNLPEGYVNDDPSILTQIMVESAAELYKLHAGVLVADVMIEEQVMEGADPSVLLEGFFADFWTKVKNIFVSIKNKITQAFAAIKRSLTIIFTSGKTFADKYEKEIEEKATKVRGFKYTMYPFVKAGVQEIQGSMKSAVSEIVEQFAKLSEDQIKKGLGSENNVEDLDSEKKAFLANISVGNKAETIADLEKKTIEFLFGGSEKEEIIDFNKGLKVAEMLATLKDQNEIKEVNTTEKELTDAVNKVISKVDSLASGAKEDTHISANAKQAIEMARFQLSASTAIAKAFVKYVKAKRSECESCLKSFLRFKPTDGAKPAKESTESTGISKPSSILESAMKFI